MGSFLDTFPPSEIVLPYTLENGGLHTVLSNSDHNLIKFIKRQHYNDNKGKEMIRHIATAESSSVELEVGDSYLALAAFHALLKYTQFGESQPVEYRLRERACKSQTHRKPRLWFGLWFGSLPMHALQQLKTFRMDMRY